MLRTQISLTEEQRRALDTESTRTGKSMSELVRHAVDATYLGDQDRRADVEAIEAAAGGWSQRTGDDAVDGATYTDRLRSGRRMTDR
jgi:predicted DNA-binding protein